MAAKGRVPTLTNGDLPVPTAPGTNAARINEEVQALWSLASAPRGIQVNGDHVVSQEHVNNSVAAINSYITDQWAVFVTGAAVLSAQRLQASPPGSFVNYVRLQVTTADAAVAATDRVIIDNVVEGYRAAALGWGASGARRILVGLWVRCSITGTFGIAITNATRSYPQLFTINAANTWEFKLFEIPGDTSGTWDKTTGVGFRVRIYLMGGTNFHGTVDTWNAGNVGTTAAQTNFAGTLNTTFDFTGLGIFPIDAASLFDATTLQDRWHLLFRPFDEELQLCQRYYEKSYEHGTVPATVTSIGAHQFMDPTSAGRSSLPWKVRKRVAPTVTWYSSGTGATGNYRDGTSGADFAVSSSDSSENGVGFLLASHGAADEWIVMHYTAAARL